MLPVPARLPKTGVRAIPPLTPIRATVAGAGAVGCVVAAALAGAGHAVSVLARGATLDAIRAHGVGFEDGTGACRHPVAADSNASFGVQDIVFLCAKAHDLPAMAQSVQPLIGPDTIIVPLTNGVPFWFFAAHPGPRAGAVIQAVDPHGTLATLLPLPRIVGAVVYITASSAEPGLSACRVPPSLLLGELAGGGSDRLDLLRSLLPQTGLAIRVTDDLRPALWSKLIVNVSSNLVSVATETTLETMCTNSDLAGIITAIVDEGRALAACFGVSPDVDAPRLLRLGATMGPTKTSTLQDYERGRRLEIAAIGDALLELGALHDLPMPATSTLVGLVRFLGARFLDERRFAMMASKPAGSPP